MFYPMTVTVSPGASGPVYGMAGVRMTELEVAQYAQQRLTDLKNAWRAADSSNPYRLETRTESGQRREQGRLGYLQAAESLLRSKGFDLPTGLSSRVDNFISRDIRMTGIDAALAGKHVMTEKPIDINLDKIDGLVKTCAKSKVKLACIFQHRFNPHARRLKAALEQGKFGQLLFCNISVKWFRAQSYYDGDDWRGTWALDGGVLSNQAIHYIDQMVWLMGEVKEVTFAEIATRARRMEAEDIAEATVHFSNGAWGSIQASTITWPGLATRIEVCGTTGAAVMEGDGLTFYRVEGEEEKIEGGGGTSAAAADPALGALTGHDAQIANFIAALREDRDPYVTGREARRSVALLTEIYRKATGRAMLGGG